MLPGFRVSSRTPGPVIWPGYMQGISTYRHQDNSQSGLSQEEFRVWRCFRVRRRKLSLLNLAGAVVLVIRNHGAFFNLS